MKTKLIALPLLSGALLIPTMNVQAEGVIEVLTGNNVNDAQILKNWGIEVGGWADAGITYASHNNPNHSNSPIPFGTQRINDFMLNQVNLYLEKAVTTSGSAWDIGGRVDFMFGTDAPSTQAGGWDDQILGSDENKTYNSYDIAFPQAYIEIYAPIGNGLTAKLGHFYTIIGYEVVTSPDNFFYSHAFTMNYGEPFTHTGALLSYQVSDNLSVSGGVVDGWDNFRRNGGDWSFLGGVNWNSDDEATAVAVSLITGENGDDSVGQNTTMYSIVATHDFSDKIHYVFQHDFGVVEGGHAPGDDADWYGINQYLTYDLNEQFSTGLRAEWFSDRGGRINNFGANYYAVSVGVNYSANTWLKFRPEVRYDWADTNGAGKAFRNQNDQVQVAMDMIVTF